MNKVQYVVANLTLLAGAPTVSVDVTDIPEGSVTHIAQVNSGNTYGKLIDLAIKENGQVLLKPCDIRFSEKTANGNFLESLRPVSGIDGGRKLTVEISAHEASRANAINFQVLFVVQPKELY